VPRGWPHTIRQENRGHCIVGRDLHRLVAIVRKQEAAEDHASKKRREEREHHYAIASRRKMKSPQLLVQKFLVA